jgi:GTP cyclohydrolase I
VIRDLAVELNQDDRVNWYNISVTSAESIHNHDAFAELSRDKKSEESKGQYDTLRLPVVPLNEERGYDKS